jgi:DNA mismatch repair ATPase MutS
MEILAQALDTALTYDTVLLQCADVIAEIDTLSSLAQAAIQNDWICPTLVEDRLSSGSSNRGMRIQDLKHALLAELLGYSNVVGNDVSTDNSTYAYLLTGPNMGGKSTYMRSIGLAVILTQIGSYIPAKSATMLVYNSMYIRSGSSDSSTSSMSSFMIEMQEMSYILQYANSRSLVLLDEVGRGTSVQDGFGLAYAILEELAYVNKSTLFCATHLHDLDRLAKHGYKTSHSSNNDNSTSVFQSLHVEAVIVSNEEEEEVRMLYKVVPGHSDLSLGLAVGKMANLPMDILEDAAGVLCSLQELDGTTYEVKEEEDRRKRMKI